MGHSKWGVLYLMSAAIFISTMDTTMMSVAIGALVRDLNTTVTGVQGAITLYSLIMAAFMIPGAKLADIWGTKKVFFRGLVLYTIGTLMTTFAPDLPILVLGWSVLEGIGGAMILPVTFTYITKAYRGKDRVFAFSLWGAINGVAAAFGPIIGGFFTTYITWRLGFFMEAIIAAGIFIYMKLLQDYRSERAIKLDVVGSALIGTALFLLTLSILLINPFGKAPVGALMFLGLILVFVFWWYERRRSAKGEDVLFDMALFRSRIFLSANLISASYQINVAGVLFVIPVFLQSYLHYDALQTGLIILSLSVTLFVSSIGAGYLGRFISPKRVLQLGIMLSFIGFYGLYRSFGLDVTGTALIPGLAIYGMGIGLVIANINNFAMMGLKPEQQADASGLFNTLRNFGYSLGTAFLGAILIIGAIYSITRQIYESGVFEGASRDQIREAVIHWILHMQQGDLAVLPQYQEIVKKLVSVALVDSMRLSMVFMMFILLLSAVFSFFLPKGNEEEKEPGQGTEGSSEERAA